LLLLYYIKPSPGAKIIFSRHSATILAFSHKTALRPIGRHGGLPYGEAEWRGSKFQVYSMLHWSVATSLLKAGYPNSKTSRSPTPQETRDSVRSTRV